MQSIIDLVNKGHPEQKEDECFVGNNWDRIGPTERMVESGFRLGNISYDKDGEIIKGYHPVFIKKNRITLYCQYRKN